MKNINYFLICLTASASLLAGVSALASSYTASDFNAVPPLIADSSDPFVMINLSVELTQQAEAYTDGAQTLLGGTECPGRQNNVGSANRNGVGICYSKNETYLGYFDSEKCYEYVPTANTGSVQQASGPDNSANPSYFKPVGYATDHECAGKFSGNFMNWATMTALDEFRSAMTGGARLVDTHGANAKTLLTRTHRYGGNGWSEGQWAFVDKYITSLGGGIGPSGKKFNNSPSKVTPFDKTSLFIDNDYGGKDSGPGNKVRFRESNWSTNLGEYNVIVEVCNKEVGLEANCVKYTDGTNVWYKPEGVMQKNAQTMRYALTSYTADHSQNRNGGVLRANAKYIGYLRPKADGGLEINPNAEIDEYGRLVFNPDKVTISSAVKNSGILNYINSFGLGSERYKTNDPVSELYYESLRYFMGLDPTPEYSGAYGSNLPSLTNAQYDNFPVITSWDDPISDVCQANYMVAIGDQFAHRDYNLPGSVAPTTTKLPDGRGIAITPSNVDLTKALGETGYFPFSVRTMTDKVGDLEGFTGNTSLGSHGANGDTKLGSFFHDLYRTYYMSGMAYYAATEDIRPDLDGVQTIKTFIIDTQEYKSSPPVKKDNILWLAAKYGGFNDLNGDKDPNNNGDPSTSNDEWDADGDGHPDAYTLASQPANLIRGLNNAFNEIAGEVRAGSSAGLSVNGTQGVGMVVRGLFKPKHVKDSDVVEWVGLLQALLVDEYLNLREDTDGDGAITNADRIIEFVVGDNKATVSRYTTADGGKTRVLEEKGIEIEALKSLWEARDELAAIADVTTQRNYGSSASGGRYILTSLDSDFDGITLNGDQVDFVASTFEPEEIDSDSTDDEYRLLGLTSSTRDNYANIVNYIRGDESISGFRSRSIDYDNDGVDERWILGDIINSSPLIVGAPSLEERFDIKYKDDSYVAFYEKYKNRRQVVYTGANDGMLHAFNGGFYDRSTKSFKTSLTTETAHPLGSELWAYVPYNALPHLQWLTNIDYPHVYYVDGIPQSFDVNIFPNDADHPNGWGTILVVGMRFGGGEYTLDPNSDTDADLDDDITLRSSYIIFDITNPEKAPKLIAELSHPNMGYTTTRPTVMLKRVADPDSGSFVSPNVNKWYLVFGSGPYGDDAVNRTLALDNAVSNQNAKLFVFDLNAKSFVNYVDGGDTFPYLTITGGANGFTGDFQAVDWDRDYETDVAYFGLVTGDVANPDGGLLRFKPGSSFSMTGGGFTTLLAGVSDQPFMGQAHTLKKGTDNWVFTGSGRYLVSDDSVSSGQMGFYGIKDNDWAGGTSVNISTMLNASNIYAQYLNPDSSPNFVSALLYDENGDPPVSNLSSEEMPNFAAMQNEIKAAKGWYIEFSETGERSVGRSDSNGETVVYRSYVPSTDACQPAGVSYTNSAYYSTGTAPPFGSIAGNKVMNGKTVVESRLTEGYGLIRDVHIDDQGIISGGTGIYGDTKSPSKAPTSATPAGRVSWREIQIDW